MTKELNVDQLNAYADSLAKLAQSGHKLDREISEVVTALREAIGLEDRDKIIQKKAKMMASGMVDSFCEEVLTAPPMDKESIKEFRKKWIYR